MADTKITALTALTAADPANDVIPIVDISDTSMAASGTTKKISVNNILGASGTATLASATITGDLTAARLIVTGGTIPANGLWLPTTNTLEFAANTLAQYRIAPLGVFSWYDGAGGTRMTLNATGLGIGGPAVSRLTLGADTNTDGSNKFTFYRGGTSGQYSVIENAGGTVYRSYGTGGHFFYINNGTTEAFRVDTSGNVGIGVAPSAWASFFKAIQINNRGAYISATSNSFSSAPFVQVGNNGYYDTTNSRWEYVTANAAAQYVQAANSHLWYTAASGAADAEITDFATAKMTLDASGNLLIGTTTNTGSARIYTEVGGNGHVVKQTSAGGYCFGANAFSNGGTYYLTYFEAAGTAVGSITSNGTGVTYGTLSDYRLKEAVQPLVGGLARVSALKPSIYKWKSDGSSGEGFLAHELADVVPSAVIGSKDEVNEDGSIKAQGVDLSKVVPILVAAIQELTARVQTLEAK